MRELFGTNKRMGKRQETGALKPVLQDEFDSIASCHPRRRKTSDPKTRADWALQSWLTTCLVETTQTMVWVDDALQPWMPNHLVEVKQ